MTLGNVVFVVKDTYFSADEAVRDASAAVYVGSFHDYVVLYLGFPDGDVVAYNGGSVRRDESIVRVFMSQRSSRIFRLEWRP